MTIFPNLNHHPRDRYGRPAMLSEGSTEQEAAIVAGDPAVQQGVMRAELFPYRIALMA